VCDIILFPPKTKGQVCCREGVRRALAIEFPGDFMENSLTGEFYCGLESWGLLSGFFGCLGHDVQSLETVAELYKVWLVAAPNAKAVLEYIEHPARFRAARQTADKRWLDYIHAVAEGDLQLARDYVQGSLRTSADTAIS
jgi:hypothetical protein